MTNGEILLAWAIKYHGVTEKSRRDLVDIWMKGDGHLPWCAGFLLSGMEECKLPLPSGGYWPNRATMQWMRAYESAGLIKGPSVLPNPGDIRFSTRSGGGHVDIVVARTPQAILCLGGNLGDAVRLRNISRDSTHTLGWGEVG